MNMEKIARMSLVVFALTGCVAASQANAQTAPQPRRSLTPDVSIDADLPALPALPDLAFQDPGKKPLPKVKGYTDRNDRDDRPSTTLYQAARNSIEQEQYARALGQLDSLIARFDGKSVTEAVANRVDAAMYWRAYALAKQRELTDAVKTLDALQSKFADSRWLKDAMALKVEVMQASGQAVSPDSQSDEDLKLLALRGLMQSDPDRAVPMVEQILSGNSSLKVKENALFVLSQSRSTRARDILANIAKGGANPDLQLRAIRYLGVMRGADTDQILDEAFRSSNDEAVRRSIIRSFMISGNRARLAAIAADANTGESLRGEAIQQLGILHANDDLGRLYSRESSGQLKHRIIQALFISRDATRLVELAKAEKDVELKKDIVQKLSLMKSKEATDYLVELLK